MKLIATAIGLLLALGPGAGVKAQDFPTRPVTSLGPFGAGGGADVMLRALADVIQPYLGQPMIHVNKPGAAGTLAGATVTSGKPDGYTIVTLISTGAVPEIYRYFNEAPYTSKDLKPLMRLNVNPYALFVHADSPWKTLDEFIAAAKARPGELTYAHAGRGHVYHLFMTSISNKTGIKLRDVPTQGGGPTVTQLLGKHVDAGMASVEAGIKHFEAGTLRMLAVEYKERVTWAKNVPTFAELGYNLGLAPWYLSTFVHADTPDPIAKKLHDSLRAAMNDPKFVDVASKMGLFMDYGTADDVRKDIETDRKVIGSLLQELGMWK